MGRPTNQQIQAYMTTWFRERLITEAEQEGIPVSEYITRLAARARGVDEDTAVTPRRRAGRPAKLESHAKPGKKKKPPGE